MHCEKRCKNSFCHRQNENKTKEDQMITKEKLEEIEKAGVKTYLVEKDTVAVPLNELAKRFKASEVIGLVSDIWSYDGQIGNVRLKQLGLTGIYAIFKIGG